MDDEQYEVTTFAVSTQHGPVAKGLPTIEAARATAAEHLSMTATPGVVCEISRVVFRGSYERTVVEKLRDEAEDAG